jgi:hypothetical protein
MAHDKIGKRQFLAAGLALGAGLASGPALAQSAPVKGVDDLGRNLANMKSKPIPRRKARTTKLFLAPPSWPNALAADPGGKGFWVQQQRHDSGPETAWLLDMNGKILKSVVTKCVDCSGMTIGNGFVWSGANGESVHNPTNPPVEGIFQTDMNGKKISQRQVPFGPKDNGGSIHGLAWQDVEGGRLWIQSNRLDALLRMNPVTWECDFMFPAARANRLHGIECDGDFLWQVYGTQKPDVAGYEGYTPGLIKYDIKTGKVLEFVDFEPGSCDIHDVAVRGGQLFGIDAGEHPGWPIDNPKFQRPGWPALNSPSAGWIFRIDVI